MPVRFGLRTQTLNWEISDDRCDDEPEGSNSMSCTTRRRRSAVGALAGVARPLGDHPEEQLCGFIANLQARCLASHNRLFGPDRRPRPSRPSAGPTPVASSSCWPKRQRSLFDVDLDEIAQLGGSRTREELGRGAAFPHLALVHEHRLIRHAAGEVHLVGD